MVVRFMPPPAEDDAEAVADRGDLAEVIELRVRMPRLTNAGLGEADANIGAPGRNRAGAPMAPVTALREAAGASTARLDAEEPESGAPARSAAEDGVRLLARRARSSGELRRELVQLGHDEAEVEVVIDEFIASLYLDDRGLARVLAQSLRERKGASRSQIRLKLRGRYLADDAIEEALGELDDDEEFALLRTAAEDRARKLGGLDRQTAERRLLGFLARRGWSGERASRAAREALDACGARSTVTFQ